jgi:hypothetical protein
MAPNLVEPVFLMPYSNADPVSDYRCVVNGSATQIIFERTAFQAEQPAQPFSTCST